MHNEAIAQLLMRKYQRDAVRLRNGEAAHMPTLQKALQEALLCSLPAHDSHDPTPADKSARRSAPSKSGSSSGVSSAGCTIQAVSTDDSDRRTISSRLDQLDASMRAVVSMATAVPQAQSTAPPSANASFSAGTSAPYSPAPSSSSFQRFNPAFMRCFNCDQRGHALKDCTAPFDAERVQRAKDNRAAKRAEREARARAAAAQPAAANAPPAAAANAAPAQPHLNS
jgi:hypothetical protein